MKTSRVFFLSVLPLMHTWVVFILGQLVINAALNSCMWMLVHISMRFYSIFLEEELLVHTDMTFYHVIFQSIE